MAGLLTFISGICHILPVCFNIASVTYPGIGTFTLGDFYDPIYRPFVMLPESPETIDPTILLYTQQNKYAAELMNWKSTKWSHSKFNPKLKTRIIIHGFNVYNLTWMDIAKDHLFRIEHSNVILVKWNKADGNDFEFLPYAQATANSRVMGAIVGILIENLCSAFKISPDSFHIIGHSLGAHISGYAGKHLQSKKLGQLGRITALDPAGPYFEGLKDKNARLWYTDAKLVDSIHVDGAPLVPFLGFGMYETCSHVDIYVNGGRFGQPGCDKDRLISVVTEGITGGFRRLIICNHARSIDYYIESILPTVSSPVAYFCDDNESFENGICHYECGFNSSRCVLLGHHLENYLKPGEDLFQFQGKRFFMNTRSHSKFLKFQYLIDINMDKKMAIDSLIPQKVIFRFIDSDANEEIFDFDQYKLYDDGLEHPQVVVLNTDPEKLSRIDFKWSHGLDVVPAKLFIKTLEITALSFRSPLKAPIRSTFIPVDNGIGNDQWVSFNRYVFDDQSKHQSNQTSNKIN